MKAVKKIIFVWSFFSMGLIGLQAQSIHFKFTDGSEREYAVSEIRSITFINDIMHLNKKDGSTVSWQVNTIGKYKYTNLVTGISLPLIGMGEQNLMVFPNPSGGDITITYNLNGPGKVSIELLNAKGELIRKIEKEQAQAGKYTFDWDGKDSNGNLLPTGTYLCNVYAFGKTSTQKISIIK